MGLVAALLVLLLFGWLVGRLAGGAVSYFLGASGDDGYEEDWEEECGDWCIEDALDFGERVDGGKGVACPHCDRVFKLTVQDSDGDGPG